MSTLTVLFYALVGLLGFLVLWLKKRLSYWQSQGIACEEPHWLMGNMQGLGTKRSFGDIWRQYYFKFKGTGPFAGFYSFQRPAAFLLDPALIKNVLIKDFNNFTDRGFFNNEADDPLSGQLFLIDGSKWRNMRNKLSPTFTSGKMKFMYPTIISVAHEFVEVFGKMVQQGADVEVRELLARFTTDVIGTCAFGIDCNSLKDPQAEFRIMGRRAITEQRGGLLHALFLNSFPNLSRRLHLKQTPDAIEAFFLRIVRETIDLREKHNIHRNDFMDMLIELKNKKLLRTEHGGDLKNLSFEEVAAQAFVFFNAGFETSSTTMGFALYELAQNLDIQQRARDEVLEVLDRHNNEFTYECIKELNYMTQIIWETLRKYTVVPIINRQAVEDYVVPGNPKYVIKKGMPVLIPAYGIHNDPDYYPNPDVFNPDNFTPEAMQARDSVLNLTFGEGPRNCIGMRFGQMQTRVGLAILLKNFKFTVSKETQIPLKYDKRNFLVSAESGIVLHVDRI